MAAASANVPFDAPPVDVPSVDAPSVDAPSVDALALDASSPGAPPRDAARLDTPVFARLDAPVFACREPAVDARAVGACRSFEGVRLDNCFDKRRLRGFEPRVRLRAALFEPPLEASLDAPPVDALALDVSTDGSALDACFGDVLAARERFRFDEPLRGFGASSCGATTFPITCMTRRHRTHV